MILNGLGSDEESLVSRPEIRLEQCLIYIDTIVLKWWILLGLK